MLRIEVRSCPFQIIKMNPKNIQLYVYYIQNKYNVFDMLYKLTLKFPKYMYNF
jgi:hypothetical protein